MILSLKNDSDDQYDYGDDTIDDGSDIVKDMITNHEAEDETLADHPVVNPII